MKDYPYGSQSDREGKDIVVTVKLFDLWSSINWWLTEYDPETKVAFGYVTGFYEDEWGTVSLEELEELELVIEIKNLGRIGKTPRIEIDKYFTPVKFTELPFHKEHSD